ncbi:unnamed protein product [Caenorhabditis nigoni]
MKGSYPRLKRLWISADAETTPNWNIVLKGLRARETEDEWSKKYIIIKNCRGISGQIKVQHHDELAIIEFTVSN